MSPEQDHNHSSEIDNQKQRLQAMLGSVVGAIHEEDYEFASEAALGQNLISPVDLVTYVHAKSELEENPEAQRRLKDGAAFIVASLYEKDQAEVASGKKRSLTHEDTARISGIMEDIEIQHVSIAVEQGTGLRPDTEPDYKWEEDVFTPDLSEYSKVRIKQVQKSVGFKTAVKEAKRKTLGAEYHVRHAREMIEQNASKNKRLQLLMFDGVIVAAAEKEVKRTELGAEYHVRHARDLVTEHASDRDSEDREVTARMLAALDKYVFKIAKKEVNRTELGAEYHVRHARDLVTEHASSLGRAHAMLDELGL